jgi:hypothetical protein
MKRRILLSILVLVLALAFGVTAALADDPPACPAPPCVYVDPYRTPGGNENGQPTAMYDTLNEGKAYAQAQTDTGGAYVISKNPDGTWTTDYVDSASLGAGGLSIPKMTLYLLLAVIALSLILAGWFLQRRSRALPK